MLPAVQWRRYSRYIIAECLAWKWHSAMPTIAQKAGQSVSLFQLIAPGDPAGCDDECAFFCGP